MKSIFGRLAAFLAVCSITHATLADARESPRGFGFDGFDGHLFLGYERFGERSGTDFTGPSSLEEVGGLAAAQVRFARLEGRLGFGGRLIFPQYRSDFGKSGGYQYRLHDFRLDEVNLRLPFQGPLGPADVQAGRFRFRSNAEAVLFGEYLIRQGAYPASLTRRDWSWESMDSMATLIEGIRFSSGGPGARLGSDVLFLFDSSAVGEGTDFSLVVGLRAALPRGFSFGVGCEWYRFLSTHSRDLATPGKDCPATDTVCYRFVAAFGDSVTLDTTRFSYSSSTTLISLRAGLDFRELFDGAAAGLFDGRLFAEAALLGWRNSPPFYEERLDRVVWTVGAHLPTFGWLDDLCLQWEAHPKLFSRSAEFPHSPDSFFAPYRSGSWIAGAFASRTVFRRISLQGRVFYEPKIENAFFDRRPVPRSGGEPRRTATVTHETRFQIRIQQGF